jgi:Glycosyl hydrolase 108
LKAHDGKLPTYERPLRRSLDPTNWSDPKNFSDDPHDPRGAAMGGITQDEYDAWCKLLGMPTRDVKLITQAEGYAIYHANYWLPECPGLSPDLICSFSIRP